MESSPCSFPPPPEYRCHDWLETTQFDLTQERPAATLVSRYPHTHYSGRSRSSLPKANNPLCATPSQLPRGQWLPHETHAGEPRAGRQVRFTRLTADALMSKRMPSGTLTIWQRQRRQSRLEVYMCSSRYLGKKLRRGMNNSNYLIFRRERKQAASSFHNPQDLLLHTSTGHLCRTSLLSS